MRAPKPDRDTIALMQSKPTIGYWSEMGGVEVKMIEFDADLMEDVVFGFVGTFSGTPKPFSRVIQYTTASKDPRAYINLNKHLLFMDECIRNPL